ncbi:MAG: ATP-binding cassette domain-containing protein [Saccharospirillum sp.]|nr:ATP-binding cassette domain-containing protein [Saccharospirillum sp.]
MSVLLSVQNLHKTFLQRQGLKQVSFDALRGISFSVEAGQALALVGESGCGKSTTARLITGMMPASSGSISIQGTPLVNLKKRRQRMIYRRAVQMVFQDPFGSLNPTRTVRHHLERPLRLHRSELSKVQRLHRINALLERVELTETDILSKYPHQLSGGQRQRVNLARALAVEPSILIADEPTSMLDVSIRLDVLKLFRQLKEQQQLGLLYITHDIATAQYVADETAVMYSGQIVEFGSTEQLINHPQHPYTRLLLSSVPDPTRSYQALLEQEEDFRHQADRIRQFSRRPGKEYRKHADNHFVLLQE